MRTPPSVPHVDDAPADFLDGGHLWVREAVEGGDCRFRLSDAGVVRFGDRDREFDADAIPEPYRHAVRYVRERLDRAALREAVGDVEAVTFFGTSTHRRGVDYDWASLPPFLGTDVRSASEEAFLPPDRAERAFTRLGLTPVNTFAKEVRAVDFAPERYEFPESDWYDGPAAGVVLADKTGGRARLPNPEVEAADPATPAEFDPEERARAWASDERFDRVAERLRAVGRPVTVETLYDRVLESVLREHHRELREGASDDERRAFRTELAAHTRAFVSEEGSAGAGT
jgi:hypothetical protein